MEDMGAHRCMYSFQKRLGNELVAIMYFIANYIRSIWFVPDADMPLVKILRDSGMKPPHRFIEFAANSEKEARKSMATNGVQPNSS